MFSQMYLFIKGFELAAAVVIKTRTSFVVVSRLCCYELLLVRSLSPLLGVDTCVVHHEKQA